MNTVYLSVPPLINSGIPTISPLLPLSVIISLTPLRATAAVAFHVV